VGTSHPLQKDVYDPTYIDLLLELCRHYQVDFVAEEANAAKWTHAERLSAFVNAGWANVDLTLNERQSMRLGETSDLTLSCDERFLDSARLILAPMELREWV
jgi:hypothetical protein